MESISTQKQLYDVNELIAAIEDGSVREITPDSKFYKTYQMACEIIKADPNAPVDVENGYPFYAAQNRLLLNVNPIEYASYHVCIKLLREECTPEQSAELLKNVYEDLKTRYEMLPMYGDVWAQAPEKAQKKLALINEHLKNADFDREAKGLTDLCERINSESEK